MNFKYYNSGFLIVFVLILTFLVAPLSQCIEYEISKNDDLNRIYDYVGVFSTISILTFILLLVNNYLWKFCIFKWLVDLPNLNGRFEGELISTYIDPITQQPTKKKCIIEVVQSASVIKIHSYYSDIGSSIQTSTASSVSEQIIKNSNGIFEVFYVFTNSASTLSTQLHNHIGTCSLKYYPDIKILEGEYYNQRGYKGTIKVIFLQRKILGRL